MAPETGSRIIKNSTFNILRTLVNIPITLVLIPYIISRLGKEEFGLWAFVGVISSYAQLSDFGITQSLIKFMAEFKEKNNPENLNRLINTAFVVYLALCIIGCTVFISILPFIVSKVLNIPLILQYKANYVFTIAIILFFINMLMGVFGSLIIGFQRMEYSNGISIIAAVLTACGTFYFLQNGYGLAGLVYNNAIITFFVIAANFFAAKRLFVELSINPLKYFCRETLGKIFNFSWKIQVSNITQLLVFQLDRVLLSHFVGLSAVSYYEIANRIAYYARSFISSIFMPVMPAVSALEAADKSEKIPGLYKRAFKYMAITSIPVSFLVIAFAHPFVRVWMGPGYEISAFTMQFLMAAYMINLLTGPGSIILTGINKPHICMKSSVVAGISNVILCFIFVIVFGYYGVIAGIFLSILGSGLYFVWMVHKNISDLSRELYKRTLVRPLFVSILTGIVIIIADCFFKFRGYAVISFAGLIYAGIVVFFIYKGDYLDDFDRETFNKINPLKVFRRER